MSDGIRPEQTSQWKRKKSHNEIINLFQNFDNLKPELEKSIKALLEVLSQS